MCASGDYVSALNLCLPYHALSYPFKLAVAYI